MRSIYTGFTLYGGADTFFAGANTGRGFRGVYEEIADETKRERVYIIKGASGTGKSTFMRKIAEEAEKAGYPVTRYLCGSDPTSLDAVVLDERIVVLDGTAPHSRDMAYPGAASALVDLSRFWKSDILRENREEIIDCTARKKAAFASGTRYLAAAETAEAEGHECAVRMLDADKLARFCARTVPKKSAGETGVAHDCRTHGIGMRGRAAASGFAHVAARRIGIADVLGTGTILLARLGDAYLRHGVDVYRGLHPVGDRITSLYIPSLGILYTLATDGAADGGVDKTIHMTRFLQKEPTGDDRGTAKLSMRIASGLVDEAACTFQKAGEAHFRLEEIYRGAMDFRALERYAKTVRAEIAGYLTAK